MSRRLACFQRWPLACKYPKEPKPSFVTERMFLSMNLRMMFRGARHRAPLAAALLLPLASCNSTDLLDSTSQPSVTDVTPAVPSADVSAMAYAGGIPFGMFALPTSELGTRYNGLWRNIDPSKLVSELAAIKSHGGKVVLMFAGNEKYYKDGSGHFSLSKWQARVDRFRNVNFMSYVKDGTIIGHYLIDEPNDPRNWGGRPVSPATIEQMAKFSKSRWPGFATVVRTSPSYLRNYSGSYHYLDAAWAQYLISRWPDPKAFIAKAVSDAKAKGLALITGLNVVDGGSKAQTQMTPTQVRTYGSALLTNTYPCAFISWQYRSSNQTSAMKDAMSVLRKAAQSRTYHACHT